MSDDFLARWSRRKRDVAQADATKTSVPEGATLAQDADPIEASHKAQPPEPAFDLADLPSIESITAATDIRPFLAPGVPADIARAALRRAWTIDPRIREFVGLADYDWDYHAAGSAAGFGPLEMTDELRQMVARIVGQISEVPGPADAACSGEEPTKINSSSTTPSSAALDPAGLASDASANRSDISAAPSPFLPPAKADVALQHQAKQKDVGPAARRGHGRALPK